MEKWWATAVAAAAGAGCSTAAVDPGSATDAAGAIDAEPPGTPDAPGRPVDAAPPVDAAASGALRVYGDDYGDGVAYAPFGGSTGGPSIDGAEPHAGTTALRFEVPAAGYVGGALRVEAPADLSGFAAVTFWVRASRPATLDVVGLGNDAATITHWAEWTAIPVTTSWTRHVVPVPDPARLTAEHGLFHVAEGASEGAYTLWLDDIQYEEATPEPIGAPSPAIATETITVAVGATHLVNGAAVTYAVDGAPRTVATSRRYFTFQSSDPAVATVDADGRVTALAPGTATITARFGALDAIGALTVHVQP